MPYLNILVNRSLGVTRLSLVNFQLDWNGGNKVSWEIRHFKQRYVEHR